MMDLIFKKVGLWLCVLFLLTGLQAQTFKYTVPTPGHMQVPGTPLWLIPPTDFEVSKEIKGFQHPEHPTASLLVVEIPASIEQIFAGMTAEALARQGMKLLQYDTISFQERESFLLTVDQQAMGLNIRKYILAFGSNKQTFMVNATFAQETEVALGDSLYQSLQTLVWDQNTVVDPLAALPYELSNATALGWQLANIMSNAAIYTLDGKIPTERPEGAVLIADKSLQEIAVYDGETFCRRRLKNFPKPLIPDEERGFTAIEIDGLKGTTCYAYEMTEDGEVDSYYRMTALFPENGGYFLLIGITKVDRKNIWEKIDQAITSFRQRR